MFPSNVLDDVAYDTGKKWRPSGSGTIYRVMRKKITIGTLPNATTKNVPHNESILPALKVSIVEFWASKGDTTPALTSMTALVSITVDATNVKITAAADQSLYTSADVIVEWAQA